MAKRMTTRSSSLARTPSPVGSESSDFYYDDPVFDSAFSSPPRAADEHNLYDSDASDPPARCPPPRSSRSPWTNAPPPPVPAASPAKRGKAGKKNKGKKRAAQDADEDDPFLAADVALAVAASLGQTTVLDHATGGASSSYRLPESPSKRIRTNPGNDAAHAAHQGTSAAGSPLLAPHAHNTAMQPNITATAPLAAAASGAPAHDAAQALPAATTHATFAAVVAAPAPVIATPAPAIAAPAPVIAEPAPSRRRPPPSRRRPPPSRRRPPPMRQPRTSPSASPTQPRRPRRTGTRPRGSYAPTPPGGFPAVTYSSALLTQGMPPGLMQLYNEVADPKFFIVVSGGNGTIIQTHGLIRVAIGDFLNVDPTSFHLGTPQPRRTTDPFCLPAASRYSPSRSTLPITGFVGTFGGFTLPNSQGGADAARDLLQTAIRANADITEFVRTHRDAFGPQVSADQAWHIFSNSVVVEGMELLVNNTVTVAWQLSVTPPTNDHGAWLQLRRLFGRLSVMTALHGTARLQRSYRCHICPSINHPTGLCPFPRLPGWLGPTPDTITALAEASRQAATRAQELIRGNTAPGPNSNAHRAGGSGGRGNANANNKKVQKDGGKGRKGGDAKGKGKRREHDDFF
ncbi:hypothetical protein B0H14DRAFT_3510148 [Mycena olivaceomarginata]|nr:hypothetical protein B0H14DRAFT_3510148 [Mycena olivaceomarginata]